MGLILSPNGRRYGALRSAPDARDYGVPFEGAAPSSDYGNLAFAPAIKDQGQEGSCTAHGGTSNTEFLFKKYKGVTVTLSPAFVYYKERELEGTLGQGDCGAQVRSSVQVMDKFGAPLLSEDAYVPGDINTAPTSEQIAEAAQYKAGAYHRLATIADIKNCIHSGYGIVIGLTVYQSFEDIGSNGLMSMPNTSTEQVLGGHEIFGGLAYDDSIQCPGANPGAVQMQNSWGTSWGMGGRLWMPYDFIANPDFVSDVWMQHLGKAWK